MSGRCSVEGGANPLARLLARLVGFPAAGQDVPVTVEMRADRDGEIWTRTIGGRKFRSHLAPVLGTRHTVTERFGPVTFDLRLVASADGLDLVASRGRLGPLPLPRWLLPQSNARERVDAQGRFTFDVPIALPGIGRLVHYRGWLVPKAARLQHSPDNQRFSASARPRRDGRGPPNLVCFLRCSQVVRERRRGPR